MPLPLLTHVRAVVGDLETPPTLLGVLVSRWSMRATSENLERALAPILQDLRSQRAWLELRVGPAGQSEDHLAVAWEPSRSGTGLYRDDSGTWAEAVVHLADQV